MNTAPKKGILVGHVADEVSEVLLVHGLREVVEDEEVGVAHLAHHLLDVLAIHVATEEASRLQLDESGRIGIILTIVTFFTLLRESRTTSAWWWGRTAALP